MSPGIQDIIKTAKAIVAFYNRSCKATEMLSELLNQLNLPVHKLVIVPQGGIAPFTCLSIF